MSVCLVSLDQHVQLLEFGKHISSGGGGGGEQATSAWKPQTLGQAQVRQAALATLSGWLSYQLMSAAGTAVGEG